MIFIGISAFTAGVVFGIILMGVVLAFQPAGELVIVDDADKETYMFLRLDSGQTKKLERDYIHLRVVHDQYKPRE